MSSNNQSTLMSDLRRSLAGKQEEPAASTVTDIKAAKQKSNYWANIGITIGAAEDGTGGTFVSLPQGIPLDDMKAVEIKGNNEDWIQLAQTKNELLALLQKAAANLKPGERITVPLEVELYRRAEPAQQAPATGNSMVDALRKQLGVTA